jgi:hypothetical protein
VSEKFTNEDLLKIVKAYYEANSVAEEAAKLVGVSDRTFRRRYHIAVRRGLAEPFRGRVAKGMQIRSVSQVFDKHGEVTLTSIKSGPEQEDGYEIPKGQELKGESVLLDSDGNPLLTWKKTGKKGLSFKDQVEIIRDVFANYEVVRSKVPHPTSVIADRLTVYPVLDWHLGMFAARQETGDKDWDLETATTVIKRTFSSVVHASHPSEEAIIMGLGDILHGDNSLNRTRRSGNTLDISGRYPQILRRGTELTVECAELVAEKHTKVRIVWKRGNHDDDSSVAIALALAMRFQDHPRITVDLSDDPFFFTEFGINLIGGTHGDGLKLPDLALIMASRVPEIWGRTSVRDFFIGHVHHENQIFKDIQGCRLFSLRAPVPRDFFHGVSGYTSMRSLYSFEYDKKLGSLGRIERIIR